MTRMGSRGFPVIQAGQTLVQRPQTVHASNMARSSREKYAVEAAPRAISAASGPSSSSSVKGVGSCP